MVAVAVVVVFNFCLLLLSDRIALGPERCSLTTRGEAVKEAAARRSRKRLACSRGCTKAKVKCRRLNLIISLLATRANYFAGRPAPVMNWGPAAGATQRAPNATARTWPVAGGNPIPSERSLLKFPYARSQQRA